MTTNPAETPAKEVAEQEQGAVAVSSGGAAAQHTLRNIGLITGAQHAKNTFINSFAAGDS